MAFNNNDYLVQLLIDQQVKTNDHLTAMREILLRDSRRGSGGAGGGGGRRGGGRGGGPPPPPPPPTGGFGKAFKELFGETSRMAASMFRGGTTASTAIGGLGASARVLQSAFSRIPGPVGLVATSMLKVVSAGAELYQYMQEQLEMYTKLSASGLSLNQGMMSVKKGTTASLMSQKEFSDSITKNADVIATMNGQYGDGIQHMGQLMGNIRTTNSEMKAWGVTQGQMIDLAAKNYKFNKMYASQQTLMQINEVNSSKEFIKQQTLLAKTLGISVDKLVSKFGTLGESTEAFVIKDQLKSRFGMDDSRSLAVSKAANELFASMENGEQMQKLVAQFMATNTIPDEFKSNQHVFRQVKELSQIIGSGVLDPVTMQAEFQKYLTQNMDNIDLAIRMAYQVGDTTTAQLLMKTRNMSKLANTMPTEVQSKLEDITEAINTFVDNSILKPFKEFGNYFETGAINWLHDVIMTDKGFWQASIDTLSAGWSDTDLWLGNLFWSMADMTRDSVKWLISDGFAMITDSFKSLVDNLINLPNLLWDKVMGWWKNGDDAKAEAESVGNGLMDAVTDSVEGMTSWWKSAKSWWNSESKTEPVAPLTNAAKNQPVSTAKTSSGKSTVTAPAEFTKPITIQPPERKDEQIALSDPAQLQAAQNHESLLRAVTQLLNSVDGQKALANQTNQMMRQLVTNTEPQHNV